MCRFVPLRVNTPKISVGYGPLRLGRCQRRLQLAETLKRYPQKGTAGWRKQQLTIGGHGLVQFGCKRLSFSGTEWVVSHGPLNQWCETSYLPASGLSRPTSATCPSHCEQQG